MNTPTIFLLLSAPGASEIDLKQKRTKIVKKKIIFLGENMKKSAKHGSESDKCSKSGLKRVKKV